ncbi:MAG TPA: 16S rRNA (adenine(1518)-N(6)/adenine(1519)-N(6))-dimethyltransferase RsmA [Thermoanaerobaculia bacterium]|nr:16S rRNA (adenine(1518)-N(6)/adenine(1519)-N(6))-dimethyltransferase RsmA [Thermoanaerobaculia bacterium]
MPKKKWGQNFLRNRGAVDRIVAAVEPQAGELIVEIGPGEGVLTEKLASAADDFMAIEIDPELAAKLQQRFGERIVNADALEVPLPERPWRAVGNLPYNVGTPILRRVVASEHWRRAVFMLQKEVAERIVAKPRDEAYGYLTLYVQLFANAKVLMTLEPKSFYPPPKVRSAVVVLEPDRKPFASEALIELISMSFRMRRKKLVNNLTSWPREQAVAAIAAAGLAEGVRAEEMGLEEFERLRVVLSR